MDAPSSFGIKETIGHIVGDAAKTLCVRLGETREQEHQRVHAATNMILAMHPRDIIETMIASLCVMLHALIADNMRETLTGQTETMRRSTRANIIAADRAFGINLTRLERYQMRMSQGRHTATGAVPAATSAETKAPRAATSAAAPEAPAPAPPPIIASAPTEEGSAAPHARILAEAAPATQAREAAPIPLAPIPAGPARGAPAPDAAATPLAAHTAPSVSAPSAAAPPAPTQEALMQETPAREAPGQAAPTRDAPTQEAPTREAPWQDVPTQAAPMRDAPTQDAPGQAARASDIATEIPPPSRTVAEPPRPAASRSDGVAAALTSPRLVRPRFAAEPPNQAQTAQAQTAQAQTAQAQTAQVQTAQVQTAQVQTAQAHMARPSGPASGPPSGAMPALIAACKANAEAMDALEAGDPARFARAMGIAEPSEAFLAAANAPGSPFRPWPADTPPGGIDNRDDFAKAAAK